VKYPASNIVTLYCLERIRRFGGTYCLYLQGRIVSQVKTSSACYLTLVSCLSYFSTLKMEAIFSSEASGSLRTTQLSNPEDRAFHSQRYENLKSSNMETVKYAHKTTIWLAEISGWNYRVASCPVSGIRRRNIKLKEYRKMFGRL
jgi:hypothetical protein